MEGPLMRVSSATVVLNQITTGTHVANPNRYAENCRVNVDRLFIRLAIRAHNEPGAMRLLRMVDAV
jgi:hypothetical protein